MGKKPDSIFAVGDIHGCHEELTELIRLLPLTKDCLLVFLGDYVDRGPDSKKVIDTILNLSEMFRVVALKGNHEELFLNFLEQPKDQRVVANFIVNGGSATLASYSPDGVTHKIPTEHVQFLKSLRTHYISDDYFFVHAGVPPGYLLTDPLTPKLESQFLWIRETFLGAKDKWEKLIVHGHTPADEVEVRENRINLDTGCVYGNVLTAMCLETKKLYQVPRKEIGAPPRQILSPTPGNPRARRFVGALPVSLAFEGTVFYEFETENFNEIGMLLVQKSSALDLEPKAGMNVSGLIDLSSNQRFEFKGIVVRLFTEEQDISGQKQSVKKMAIKIDFLQEK